MANGYSEIDICNKAILRLGANPIESDDGTVAALNDQNPSLEEQLCKLHFDLIRDTVLEDRIWSFALTRVVLDTPDPTAPAFGYTYRHLLPEDALGIFKVLRSPNTEKSELYRNEDWIVENGYILSDLEVLYVRYIKRLDSVSITLASNQFVDILSLRLAAEMAIPVTEDKQLYAALLQEYEGRLIEASSNDGQNGTHETFRSNQLIRVR